MRGLIQMKLLTKEIRKTFPKWMSSDGLGDQAIVRAKFFTPDSNWTWYAIEFDGDDTFFGLVQGFETEYGYFTLSELETNRGPLGMPIERDIYFKPCTIGEIDKR
jgi:hypothetical protein